MGMRTTRTYRVLRKEFESKGIFNDSTGTSSRLSSCVTRVAKLLQKTRG